MAEATRMPGFSSYPPAVHHHDLDQLNHAVSGSSLEIVQLKPGPLDVVLGQVSLGELSIDLGAVNVPLRVRGELDPRRFSVGAFTSGTRGTWNGNHVDASQMLFFKPGQELNGYLAQRYGWASFVVPPEWIASLAQTTRRSNVLYLQTDCRTLRPHPDSLAELWQATAHIVAPAPASGDSVSGDWLTANLRNALGAALSALDTPLLKVKSRALAHFSMACRAERYMRERIAEPMCIDDLCLAMHASRRYLEYAFTDAFGTSPSRYLRLLRLHEVRQRLRLLGAHTTVTDEALALGFNHLSLFSIQYKKAFGESPSATLAKADSPTGRRRLPATPAGRHAESR